MAGLMLAFRAAGLLALAAGWWDGADDQDHQAEDRHAAQACPGGSAVEDMLELAYDAFDQAGPPSGWRALLGAGCADAAVALLQAYEARNRDRLSPDQQSEMRFHIGQVYALAGRDAEALPHFEAATWPGATDEWAAYIEATIAFLHKDRARLEAAIARYSSARGGGGMRLGFLRGFRACLDQPYAQAVHCPASR